MGRLLVVATGAALAVGLVAGCSSAPVLPPATTSTPPQSALPTTPAPADDVVSTPDIDPTSTTPADEGPGATPTRTPAPPAPPPPAPGGDAGGGAPAVPPAPAGALDQYLACWGVAPNLANKLSCARSAGLEPGKRYNAGPGLDFTVDPATGDPQFHY